MIARVSRGQCLIARDRTFLRRARRMQERAALSPEELDARIERVIIDAAIARGAVTQADLIRANIPREAITEARFTRCFDSARARDPAIGQVETAV